MKRDDMIEIIRDELEKDFRSVSDASLCDFWLIASCLLSTIESLGMGPPFYDKTQNNNSVEIIIPTREWEPEI